MAGKIGPHNAALDLPSAQLVVGRVVPAPGHPTAKGRGLRADDVNQDTNQVREVAKPPGPVTGILFSEDVSPAERKLAPGIHRETDEAIMERLGVDPAIFQPAAETLGQGADGGGLRLNAGKNRIELLPPEWMWALADVMTQGSKKYDARNWEKGMNWSAMIGCMHRHLAKFQGGQRYDGKGFDKELGTTGCHELAMVAWNALALMVYDIRNIGTNDIPIIEQLDLFDEVNAATATLDERWETDRMGHNMGDES